MSLAELTRRLQQAGTKFVDGRALFIPRIAYRAPDPHGTIPQFFFSPDEIPSRLQLIRERLPETVAGILEDAKVILENRFPILGYGSVAYGSDVDWQRDAINEKRAPQKPWTKIRYLDFDEVGDSKVTWEVSRHQFLVTLAKAYLLTGEVHYFRKLESLYYDWQRKNPYPLGINWCSSLEVAFRSFSWIWVRALLAASPIADQLRRDITAALEFNAWYIRRYLSTYFSPNTHLLGEAAALFFIGVLCPELPKAASWRDLGWKVLTEHANAKVKADGAYFEQSVYYHVYALDFFLHVRILAERNAQRISPEFDEVLKRMLRFLSALCQAGPPPLFGDDDGGRLFDGRRNTASNLNDPISLGAFLLDKEVSQHIKFEITEECIWLHGPHGVINRENVQTEQIVQSAKFSDSGIYVLHMGKNTRSQLIFDAGPLGGGSGGHGHADALSLTVSVDGRMVLGDPGTYKYVGGKEGRDLFRNTAAHNTVVVDGCSQAAPTGPFAWGRWPQTIVNSTVFGPAFEYAEATHDGYSRLASPVHHKRVVFSCHERFWLVIDLLCSNGEHDYTLHWHGTPGSVIARVAERCWGISAGDSKLEIHTDGSNWATHEEEFAYSLAYGAFQLAPAIRQNRVMKGDGSIGTLLYVGPTFHFDRDFQLKQETAAVLAFELKNGGRSWQFILSKEGKAISCDDWSSDGRFICAELEGFTVPKRVTAISGTYVKYRGESLKRHSSSNEYFEWERE